MAVGATACDVKEREGEKNEKKKLENVLLVIKFNLIRPATDRYLHIYLYELRV